MSWWRLHKSMILGPKLHMRTSFALQRPHLRADAVAGLPTPLRELVEVIAVDDFLQLPEHMRGVQVDNKAGEVDHMWVDKYPGADPVVVSVRSSLHLVP